MQLVFVFWEQTSGQGPSFNVLKSCLKQLPRLTSFQRGSVLKRKEWPERSDVITSQNAYFVESRFSCMKLSTPTWTSPLKKWKIFNNFLTDVLVEQVAQSTNVVWSVFVISVVINFLNSRTSRKFIKLTINYIHLVNFCIKLVDNALTLGGRWCT